MKSEKRQHIVGLRKCYEEEIEAVIRLMKIEGGTLDDCTAEVHLLADFVCSQADSLKDAWPTLLRGTHYEEWERKQNEADSSSGAAEPQ